MVLFLWCCGGVFVVGVGVVVVWWWCVQCFCGGVGVVVFLWWCGGVLHGECCGEVLWGSVVEKLCREVLWGMLW